MHPTPSKAKLATRAQIDAMLHNYIKAGGHVTFLPPGRAWKCVLRKGAAYGARTVNGRTLLATQARWADQPRKVH